jgi:peroxiredoxin
MRWVSTNIIKSTVLHTIHGLVAFIIGTQLLTEPGFAKNDFQANISQATNLTEPERLKDQLEQLSRENQGKLPPSAASIMNQAIEDLHKSGILEQALRKGYKAPLFRLPNNNGKEISLSDLLKKGPVVIAFYRGGWCPYCNITLRALERSLSKIQSLGATLIAISPELPNRSFSTAEKDSLSFDLLSDKDNEVAKKFGIAYKLPDDLAKLYSSFGINLEASNGNFNNELPLAATYIINKDGIITDAFVDIDYKSRMEPSEIILVLKKIQTQSK